MDESRYTTPSKEGLKILKEFLKKADNNNIYFVIGHKMQGYEKAIIDISKELNKKFEIDAIVPKMVSKNVKEKLLDENINGIRISTESEELGIYKSFNYEIFERRKAIVIAFDGNSPVSNLVQEAKNGKGKSKIYVNNENPSLKEKADSLENVYKKDSISFNNYKSQMQNIIQDYNIKASVNLLEKNGITQAKEGAKKKINTYYYDSNGNLIVITKDDFLIKKIGKGYSDI